MESSSASQQREESASEKYKSNVPVTLIRRVQADGVSVFTARLGRRMRRWCCYCMDFRRHRFSIEN